MVSRLKDLCEFQVAVGLANEVDVKKDLKIFWFVRNVSEWFEEIEDKVGRILLQKLPFGLRKQISVPVIVWCVFRSYKWAQFHAEKFGLPFDYCYYFLKSSFFTSKGTINKEKAARELAKDTEISISIRFCIACYYCFSDVIPGLWEQIPEEKRPKSFNGVVYKKLFGRYGNIEMVKLWSRFLLGKHRVLLRGGDSFSFYKFKNSFENEISFKNCFEELNEVERKEALIFSTNELNKSLYGEKGRFGLQLHLRFQPHIEMVIYLLHHLDENQLRIFFRRQWSLYSTLCCLLSWPYRHLFLDTVNRFWDLISTTEFYLLCYRIMTMVKDHFSFKFYDGYQILKKFWMQSPSNMKRFFFHAESEYYFGMGFDEIGEFEVLQEWAEENNNELVCSVIGEFCLFPLFTSKNEEIIRMIFSSATLEEKSNMMDALVNLIVIKMLVLSLNGQKRIDLLIECCVPTENVNNFKRKLIIDDDVMEELWLYVSGGKLERLEGILMWALPSEQIKEYKQCLLHSYMTLDFILYCRSNVLKCIDNFMEWNMTSDEIKVFKESLLANVDFFVKLILDKRFDDIDNFFAWAGFEENIKKNYLENIFNGRIYEMLITLFLENKIEFERVWNWMSFNDLFSKNWKESFLNWFKETKVEGTCFYSDCNSQTDINLFCSSCKHHTPSSENISEFLRLVNKQTNKSKGNQRRKRDSSYEINTRQTKRSC